MIFPLMHKNGYKRKSESIHQEIDMVFEKGKKRRFISAKFFLTILKNIFQRELFMWYHMFRITPFFGVGNGFWTILLYHIGEELFYFYNKKVLFYKGFGVSQTPNE